MNSIKRQVCKHDVAIGDFYVKRLLVPTKFLSRLRRHLLGSIATRREVLVNKQLAARDFVHLKHPLLLSTDESVTLVFERVEGNSALHIDRKQAAQLCRAVDEFHQNVKKPQLGFWDGLLGKPSQLHLNEKLFILFPSLCKVLGVQTSIKCLRVGLLLNRSTAPLHCPVLRHNDLHRRNVMLDQNGDVVIIDYGSVLEERKWLAYDIVRFAISSLNTYIDYVVLGEYANVLMNEHSMSVSEIKAQYRFCLLLRLMEVIVMSSVVPEKKALCMDLLCGYILNDDMYDRWFTDRLLAMVS